MEDWTRKTDKEVFEAASEMPGSQASYWRETEIKRRLYVLQLGALKEQLEATKAQREAISEMRKQSNLMLWSVICAATAALFTLAAAFIN